MHGRGCIEKRGPALIGESNPDRVVCPNCRLPRVGRYCPRCGQDTHRQLAPVPVFLRRLLAEMTDLEGPFLRTLRQLFQCPGQLTLDYSERRFQSQVSPFRLYLATAAFYFLSLPIWGEWMHRTDDVGSFYAFTVEFPSPLGFALLIPMWAAAVQLSVLDRRVYYEQAFAFSAHFHVVFLVLFAALGSLSAVIGLFSASFYAAVAPFALLTLCLPAYVYAALRRAFVLGPLRSLVAAIALVVIQLTAFTFLSNLT